MQDRRGIGTLMVRVVWLAILSAACIGIVSSFASVGIEVRQPADAQEPCGITAVNDVAAETNLINSQQPLLSPNNENTVGRKIEEKTGQLGITQKACALIEQGKFDEAGQLIGSTQSFDPNLARQDSEQAQLKDIVVKWQNMQKQRRSQQETAYKEELARFERIRTGKRSDSNEVNDANDANEPNGPVAVLATVTRTIEFADEKQKQSLLSDPCLRNAIARAKADAAGLEQKGKWLDAYILCYSWLSALEPNNKEYTDYAERLLQKAEIVAGFQDSPCETVKQRYDGVKRRIFERAIDALNLNYVSKIDYQEMAAKGIRQCRSLAEVVGTLTLTKGAEPNGSLLTLGESFKDYTPDSNAIEKFCSELASLEKETADWPQGAGRDKLIAVFEKVLELNLTTARLPEGVVIAHFVEASFSALDPYTVLVWPRDIPEFEQQMTNEFTGIGIEISKQQGRLTVASLLLDTPAFNSELDVGDVIEKVNGMPTKDLPITCAVERIKGPAGTKVTLTIRRGDQEQTRDITLTRAKIVVPTVRGWQRTGEGKWLYMMDDQNKIGYIRLTSFSESTAPDMEEALKSLEADGVRGLILDLRFNPGGVFDSAVEVSDAFLDNGLIVITRPRFGIPSYEAAHKKGTHPNYPMVVLIGPGSASASEIVAGALADPSHKRATLVGERTHGKGVVQGITHYPGEGAELKYTMANWYLPSGQKIKSQEEAKKENNKDWGIGPDVAVELRSDEFHRMLEAQRDNDVLVRAGHNNTKRHSIEQTTESDPQLATGLLVIKSKLACEQSSSADKVN